jgi:hypothetical protein
MPKETLKTPDVEYSQYKPASQDAARSCRDCANYKPMDI